MPSPVNLREKFSMFSDYWSPKIVGGLNGQEVKVVKVKGSFAWHRHKEADELFWVIKGQLVVHFRKGDVQVNEGELLIVPCGIEHRPESKEETEIVLIEPKGTVNTGDVKSRFTVIDSQRI